MDNRLDKMYNKYYRYCDPTVTNRLLYFAFSLL